MMPDLIVEKNWGSKKIIHKYLVWDILCIGGISEGIFQPVIKSLPLTAAQLEQLPLSNTPLVPKCC